MKGLDVDAGERKPNEPWSGRWRTRPSGCQSRERVQVALAVEDVRLRKSRSSKSQTGVPIVQAEEGGALALPGLTRGETALLLALRELGEATADELSCAAGLKGAALSQAIERLRQLEYATPVKKQKGVARYRAKA